MVLDVIQLGLQLLPIAEQKILIILKRIYVLQW